MQLLSFSCDGAPGSFWPSAHFGCESRAPALDHTAPRSSLYPRVLGRTSRSGSRRVSVLFEAGIAAATSPRRRTLACHPHRVCPDLTSLSHSSVSSHVTFALISPRRALRHSRRLDAPCPRRLPVLPLALPLSRLLVTFGSSS